MNYEIERKFLVKEFDEKLAKDKVKIKQGYILSGNGKVVRVRTFNDKGYITVKFRKTNIKRLEYEYEIPYDDALSLLENTCDGKVLEKTRYIYYYKDKKWEIDVFEGKNSGIILAEIELQNENEEFEIPEFVICEVTNDNRYSNHNLAKR
ncbi:MAG: CYTH domain-containing protein [Clostridia bacterium]|nr:CYTH domain-containing protein [Clostridia bacterium]